MMATRSLFDPLPPEAENAASLRNWQSELNRRFKRDPTSPPDEQRS